MHVSKGISSPCGPSLYPPLAEVSRSDGGGCCRDCSPSNPNPLPLHPLYEGDKKGGPSTRGTSKGGPSMRGIKEG